MKKECLIILSLFLLFSLQIYSQSEEKTIDGKTYVIEHNKYITNKTNQIDTLIRKEKNYKNCEFPVFVRETSSVNDIIIAVLPQEKIDKFIENKFSFSMSLYCDSLGNVLEIEFWIDGGFDTISPKEISALEDALKKCRFEFTYPCPGVKYFMVRRFVHLWKP